MTSLEKLAREIKDKAELAIHAELRDSDGTEIDPGFAFSPALRNRISSDCEFRVACSPARISALMDVVLEYEKVLKWYADPSNYVVQIYYDENRKPISSFNPISIKGKHAEEALAYAEERLREV
jgi:hypothetical protein